MNLLTSLTAVGLVSLSILTPNQVMPSADNDLVSLCEIADYNLAVPFSNSSYRSWESPELSDDFVKYEARYTEEEVTIVAKILYRECRGIKSKTEQACVVWTMCNRVDAGYADTIKAVATAEDQYAWYPDTPVLDELYDLAKDVLKRWSKESAGYEDVGRVLPADYLWFSGDGEHNHFRNQYRGGTRLDYSIETPYES